MDPSTDTPFSEEEAASVLSQLETLRTSDPNMFQKLLESMGMTQGSELLGNSEESMKKMTESIMSMRSGKKEDDGDNGISLSKDKKKVSSLFQ
jgi:hypothetical protein